MLENEGLNTPKIALTGAVFVLFVAALIMALTALYMKVSRDEEDRKVTAQAPRVYTNLVIEQQTVLNTYGWVDGKKGVVRIPIDRAMELTVRDLSRGQKRTPGIRE